MFFSRRPLSVTLLTVISATFLMQKGYAQTEYSQTGHSEEKSKAKSITKRLPNATQGPLWPPSETVDKDGNFILVGTGLLETAPGVVVPKPNQALLVSKDTLPPVNAD